MPILLAYGGVECHMNSVWCPTGLTEGNITHHFGVDNNTMMNSLHAQLQYINTFDKNYSFVSTELLLFTISCASILGRLFAGNDLLTFIYVYIFSSIFFLCLCISFTGVFFKQILLAS
ncbi:unnamed protein product [Trichobilharzia regenti]|nr:unnamed protein product [Trichobilharzia regenti]